MPNTPENVQWVQTSDEKIIKLHANFANNVLHIDKRLEELYEHDVTSCNSQNNPYYIPCSAEELRLVLEATLHLSLLQFTENELDTLNNVATKLNISFILSMISNIRLLTLSSNDISSVNLNTLLGVLRNNKIDDTTTVRFFGIKNLSNASLFRDIMSLYIKPEVLTKEQFTKMQQDNLDSQSKKKELDIWVHIKGAQYRVLFYTQDEKYYITDHIIIKKPYNIHQYRIYSSTTDELIDTLSTKYKWPRPLLFPNSNKLVCAVQEQTESYCYRNRYFIYNIEQQKTIALPQDLPLFTTIAINQDGTIIACAAADGVYVMNITNTENIIYKSIPHPFPKHLAFSPNGLHLTFGCTRQELLYDNLGATIGLCNIKDIDWNSEKAIESKVIAKGIECFNIRFTNDNTIIVDNETGRFAHQDIVIDISDNATQIETLSPRHTHANSEDGALDIYETFEAQDRKIRDFSAIVSKKKLSIYSPSYKTLFSREMDMTNLDQLIVSCNRKYWATTPVFNLLSLDSKNIFSCIETELKGNCLKLNDDGSFWLSTQNSIDFYNSQRECYMIFDCKPFYLFYPEIKEKENQIICYHWDQYDTDNIISHKSKVIKEGCITRWQIPSQDDTQILYTIIDKLTPLQYIFIKDICAQKKQDGITLRKGSLHEKIFASFTDSSKEIVGDYLRILPS